MGSYVRLGQVRVGQVNLDQIRLRQDIGQGRVDKGGLVQDKRDQLKGWGCVVCIFVA